MMRNCQTGFLAALLLAFVGCEDRTSLRTDVIRCGTVTFNRSMADQLISARVTLAAYQFPNQDKRQLENIRRNVSSNVIAKLKQDFIVTNYLGQIGTNVSEDAVEQRLTKVFRSVKRKEAFLSKQTDETKFFIRDLARADVALETMRSQVVAQAHVRVSDEEIRKTITKIERYNATALATNALIYANASNCWRKIKSGEISFVEASFKYENSHDHSESRVYWGEFPLSALVDDVVLCRMLPSMTTGDVTPPIEADNGLCIVQLVEVVQNAKKGANLSPEAYYRLNKIFFELPIVYETPTVDNVRCELMKKEEDRVFSDFMRERYKRFGF